MPSLYCTDYSRFLDSYRENDDESDSNSSSSLEEEEGEEELSVSFFAGETMPTEIQMIVRPATRRKKIVVTKMNAQTSPSMIVVL